ncbi:uncharacterized protein EDB91DRAFT_1084995 [Suillus paluster]|uniref:uncharacterized protein n=1 Tax=Suillus paluster TaxID=48578 RepID=UPI001B86119F|nr:uncharacterized protein EDB91DRAFT_1084995 [Suillus paluster]KAG1731639.1 hypothetical protein EDB91DRAFT_1084995 [Suillus paluster]
MDIHGEDEPANIFADNTILDCDMPASHKCNGTVGHSHDFHPCAFCDVDIVKVNTPEGYDNSCTPKDDYQMLRQSFYSKDATQARQDAILKDFGVRWSILNLILGWLPSKKSVLNFMHAIFLGIISHLFIIGGINSPRRRFEEIINALYCGGLGETRMTEIPDKEPPLPPNTVQPDFSRNCRSLYQTILLLCTDARVGQSFISHYCLESLQLQHSPDNQSPHINAHIRNDPKACSNVSIITVMTEAMHLIYEYLLALPPDTCPFEQEQINRIIKVQAQTRGSMMSQIAVYHSKAAEDNVRLPLQAAKFIDLRLWPQLRLINDLSHDDGTPFLASKVARWDTLWLHYEPSHAE